MFGLFGKKSTPARHRDLIYSTTAAKWAGLEQLLQQYPQHRVFAWFDDTITQAQQALGSIASTVISPAHGFRDGSMTGHTLVLLEHHPLAQKEAPLLQAISPVQVIVLSALDEPLLLRFGGDRIAGLMEKMGLAAGDFVEHNMIRESIRRAQERIAAGLVSEPSARSAAEWLRKYDQLAGAV